MTYGFNNHAIQTERWRYIRYADGGEELSDHATDPNAWRNIARVSMDRNQFASLIVAAYHVGRAGKKVIGPGAPLSGDDDLLDLFRERAEATKPDRALAEAEEAIRANDQIRAAAAVLRYSELKTDNPRPVFDLLSKYAFSEDGRLHPEKYYRTVTEEFASIRPAYRWRELISLAQVTASCYGMARKDKKGGRAPGYLDALKLLNLA
jgi:hypothetical protein